MPVASSLRLLLLAALLVDAFSYVVRRPPPHLARRLTPTIVAASDEGGVNEPAATPSSAAPPSAAQVASRRTEDRLNYSLLFFGLPAAAVVFPELVSGVKAGGDGSRELLLALLVLKRVSAAAETRRAPHRTTVTRSGCDAEPV